MNATVTKPGSRINWLNVLTVLSAAILISAGHHRSACFIGILLSTAIPPRLEQQSKLRAALGRDGRVRSNLNIPF